MEVSDEEQDNNSFLVTLKKSHVDKKVHGVVSMQSQISSYKVY